MNSCHALHRCVGLGLVIFATALSSAFAANRQQVNHDIALGINGLVPESRDTISHVTVTIDNQIGSTVGQIKITQPDASGSFEVTHVLPFETPAPSVKRFVVPVRLEDGRGMAIAVLFDKHIKPIHKTLKVQRSDKPLILCLGVPPLLKASKVSEKYRFVNIAAQSLPDTALAFDEAHAVMLSGLAFASLDKDQVSALRAWTATGGRTIIADCPPDETFRTNFKRLVGSTPIDPQKRGVSFVGAGLVACAGPTKGSDAAFWEGRQRIVKALFPEMAEKDDGMFGQTGVGNGHLSNLWRTKRTYGFFAFLSIILIVGAYVLAIGPLDWWLVRRFKKPYLTWIIFSCSILLFSFLAYSYSNLVNVGAMRAVQVSVLDASHGTTIAKGNSQLWVYSVKNTTYNMDTPIRDAVLSARESSLGAGHVTGVSVENGMNSRLAARIPIFSSKEFDATWLTDWNYPVTFSKKNGLLAVKLPEDSKVKHAYLADARGLTILNEQDDLWVADKNCTTWQDATWSNAQSLGSQYAMFGSAKKELMPKEEVLRHYLICMSFPWEISKDKDEWGQTAMYKRTRNAREAGMDIRYRLQKGRVLLLFLDEDKPLLPINFSKHNPKTVHIDLIRLQIPEHL